MSNFDRFMDNVNALARASVRNRFVIERKNSDLLDVPVLVLIIALFLNLPLVLFLMLLGLFLGCRYHFGGNDTVAKSANDMSEQASNFAESLITEISTESAAKKEAEKEAEAETVQ